MKTGFKNLDEIIDIAQPQVILLTGTNFVDMLSGDIANNICLKQECEVLEVISHKKEYLVKRLLTNECNVNYRKWTVKNQYTSDELQQIGQNTVNLIETTKRLPTIIEQDISLYKLKNVTKLVLDYANKYADRDTIETLVVLDLFPLNAQHISRKQYRKEIIKLFKEMKKISKKLKLPITIVYNVDINKKYNLETYQPNFLTKQDIEFIDSINKYVDKFIIANLDTTKGTKHTSIYNVAVYDTSNKIGTCKLEYDFKYRKFKD